MSGSADPSNILQLFTNVSVEGPKMAFGNGQAANNQPVLLPGLPNIASSPSNWDVIEWAKGEYLQPGAMQVDDSNTYDPLFGNAAYSWSTSDGESDLRAYRRTDGSWAYDLIGSGGVLTAGGGANLLLSAKANVLANFASPITYQVDARITQADIKYFDPTAASTGAVLAQVFTGFIATFNAPSTATYDPTLPTWTAFIQLPISDSGADLNGALYDNVQKSPNGGGTIIYSHLLPGESALAYQLDTGPLHTLSYNLNAHLSDLIAQSGLGAAEQDMSKWTLSSMYIGLETETASATQGASPQPQGTLTVGLELADISVVQDQSETYTYGSAVRAPGAGQVNIISPSAGAFLIQDLTTDQFSMAAGAMTGSTDALVDLSPDDLVITAQVPNTFILSGSGNDILIAQSGDNVLDSTGGVMNFLFGGGGTDTFFLNPQSAPVTWNTLAKFQQGDVAVLWDITPQSFQFSFADGQGVPAYSGLTLREMAPGRAAFVTLAGYTGADLSDGKLRVAFGTDVADGRSYMLIMAAG